MCESTSRWAYQRLRRPACGAGLRTYPARPRAASKARVIPPLSVVPHPVFAPDARRLLAAHLREVIPRAAPGPIRPEFDVAMVDRVVVDVIERGPEVPLGAHEPLGGAVENLP